MYFYMNPRRQVFLLQGVIVVILIILGVMIYNQYSSTQSIQKDLDTLDVQCPKCPDVTVNNSKSNPESSCPDVTCPDVCPDVKCPSVKDIVNGVFPGRNTGLTSGGKYFDVKSQGSYDLLREDYSFYKAEDAFPDDSILDPPLRWSNPDVPLNDINNSVDNYLVDSRADGEARDQQFRMDKAKANASKMQSGADTMGKNTSPKMGSIDPKNSSPPKSSADPSPSNT
jgi:hypothetical protein